MKIGMSVPFLDFLNREQSTNLAQCIYVFLCILRWYDSNTTMKWENWKLIAMYKIYMFIAEIKIRNCCYACAYVLKKFVIKVLFNKYSTCQKQCMYIGIQCKIC